MATSHLRRTNGDTSTPTCWWCNAPAEYLYPAPCLDAGDVPACERCARRDHDHCTGQIFATLGVLAVVLETLRDAGMTDDEILHSCAESLEDPVAIPDKVAFPVWAVRGFDDDPRVKRIVA